MYTIYKRTTPDGNVYIGCTSKSLAARAGIEGAGYRQSPLFWAAILEWGWSRIESEVLSTTDSAEEAKRLETDAISQAVNDYGSDKLLNTKLSSSYCQSEERNQKLAASLRAHYADENNRQAMSDAVKNSDAFQKAMQSDERRAKIAASSKGRVWIHKEDSKKFVPRSELPSFLEQGWLRGMK